MAPEHLEEVQLTDKRSIPSSLLGMREGRTFTEAEEVPTSSSVH
jgi:hypothetical protein